MQVSIIIPLYNAACYIEQSLASVLAQRLDPREAEVIVVDDGSTDDGPERAVALLRTGMLGFRLLTQANAGPAAARNAGLAVARGEWIQFFDADDVLHVGKIRAQLDWLAGLPSTGMPAIVHSEYATLERGPDGSWREGAVCTRSPTTDVLAHLLSSDGWIPLQTCLIKRRSVEAVGGFEAAFEPIEDVRLATRLALRGEPFARLHLGFPAFWYRRLDSSLSQASRPRFFGSCYRHAAAVEDELRSAGSLTTLRRERLVGSYFTAARALFGSDDEEFASVVDRIERLALGALPDGPPMLRTLARVVGYRQAEAVALRYRRAKALLRGDAWRAG